MTAAVASSEKRMPWWILLVQGIVAVLVGFLLLANPLQMANLIVFAIALYWLVSGVIAIIRIFTDKSHWGWKLFMGIIGILAGWFLITNMGEGSVAIFGLTVILVLAIQGIIMGIVGLIEAFQGGGWGPGIMGAISIVIGILLLGNMVAATLVLPWVIGVFAIVGGIFAIIMAFRLR